MIFLYFEVSRQLICNVIKVKGHTDSSKGVTPNPLEARDYISRGLAGRFNRLTSPPSAHTLPACTSCLEPTRSIKTLLFGLKR